MQFKSKINILRITSTPAALGHTEVANVLHNSLPCRINWKKGSQKIFFGKDSYFRDGVVYCRKVDITTDDRVQYSGKIYRIEDVTNIDETNKYLTLTIKLVQ